MKKILSLTIAALAACTMLSASGKVHVLTSSSYLDNDKMVFVPGAPILVHLNLDCDLVSDRVTIKANRRLFAGPHSEADGGKGLDR